MGRKAAHERLKAKKIYERFSGYAHNQTRTVDLGSMKALAFLGKAYAIEYVVQKHSDRKEHVYRHEFENAADVFTNGKEIIVHGPNITITKRGVEG